MRCQYFRPPSYLNRFMVSQPLAFPPCLTLIASLRFCSACVCACLLRSLYESLVSCLWSLSSSSETNEQLDKHSVDPVRDCALWEAVHVRSKRQRRKMYNDQDREDKLTDAVMEPEFMTPGVMQYWWCVTVTSVGVTGTQATPTTRCHSQSPRLLHSDWFRDDHTSYNLPGTEATPPSVGRTDTEATPPSVEMTEATTPSVGVTDTQASPPSTLLSSHFPFTTKVIINSSCSAEFSRFAVCTKQFQQLIKTFCPEPCLFKEHS